MSREYHIEPNALIEQCLQGDRTAQYQLYRKYVHAMYNTAWRIVKNDQEAEDVTQEAFISAFEHLYSFQGTATFGAWLKRIVVNKALNLIQKRRLEFSELAGETEIPEEEQADYSPSRWEIDRIRGAIEELPDGYRIILSLYLLEGYDHVEISEIMNISVGTSKSQYNRAKKKLRQMLNVMQYER